MERILAKESRETGNIFVQGAYSNQQTYDFPELILEHILNVAGDVRLGKKCRLVCKYWNRIACRFLRANAGVRLLGGTKTIGPVKNFFNQIWRASVDDDELPSPFRDISVEFWNFNSTKMYDFIIANDLNVTSLKFNENVEPMDLYKVYALIQKFGSNLRKLECAFTGEKNPCVPREPQNIDALVRLNYLSLSDDCNPSDVCLHVQYLHDLLHLSSARNITLKISSKGNLASILGYKFTCKPNVTSLSLDGNPNEDDLQAIGNIIPSTSLTVLLIHFSYDDGNFKHAELVVPLLERARSHLTHLEISDFTLLEVNFELPKVRHLKILADSHMAEFPPHKFPNLKTVDLRTPYDLSYSGDFVNESVITMIMCLDISSVIDANDLEDVQKSLEYCSKKAPNVSYLSIDFGHGDGEYLYLDRWNGDSVMHLLHYNFPRVKSLHLGNWWCTADGSRRSDWKDDFIGEHTFHCRRLEYALGLLDTYPDDSSDDGQLQPHDNHDENSSSTSEGGQCVSEEGDSASEKRDSASEERDSSSEGRSASHELANASEELDSTSEERESSSEGQDIASVDSENVEDEDKFKGGITIWQDVEELCWFAEFDSKEDSVYFEPLEITATMITKGLAKMPKLNHFVLDARPRCNGLFKEAVDDDFYEEYLPHVRITRKYE